MYIGRSGPVCTGEDLNEFERKAHQTYLSQLYRKSTSYDNQEFDHNLKESPYITFETKNRESLWSLVNSYTLKEIGQKP